MEKDQPRLELILASVMRYGTLLASFVTITGLVSPSTLVVKAGIGLFILLPIARVTLMLTSYLKERDYVFVGLSVAVLAITLAGIVIGICE